MNKLKFNQYLEIADMLNDGYMMKSKANFVRRTSSKRFGDVKSTSMEEAK